MSTELRQARAEQALQDAHLRADAKKALRAALAAVFAVSGRNLAPAVGISYSTLYGYADDGTTRATGKQRGPGRGRKAAPPLSIMRKVADAMRDQALMLLEAADRLQGEAERIEDALAEQAE